MIEKDEIAAAIAGSELFGTISREGIDALAGIAHGTILPAGSWIVCKGDRRINGYLIAAGRVQVFGPDRTAQGDDFEQLGQGESFEEVALLTDAPSSLSFKTVTETSLIVIPRARFSPVMANHADVVAAVGNGISRWIDGTRSAVGGARDNKRRARRLRWFDYVLIIGLSVVGALVFNMSNPKGIPLTPESFSDEAVASVTVTDAFTKKREGKVIFLDARPSESYEQEHIADAESLPLATFDFMYDLNLGREDKATAIIVYGRTISRLYDEEVAKKLVARGHRNVAVMTGGLDAWKKNGYPVAP